LGTFTDTGFHGAAINFQRLRVTQLVKKVFAFRNTRKCISALTRAHIRTMHPKPLETNLLAHILFKINFNIIGPSVPHVSQVGSYFQVPRLQMYMAYALSFFTTCPIHTSLWNCTAIIPAYLKHGINNEALHPPVIFMFLLFLSVTRSQTQSMAFPRVKDHVQHLCQRTRNITALYLLLLFQLMHI
jgi:hypothetical protein